MSAPGDLCSKALFDNHGRNEGCRGRLVSDRFAIVERPNRPRTYLSLSAAAALDPQHVKGLVALVVCPRCGQSHGRLADEVAP